MPLTLWSQDNFTQGEISPLMYARVSVNGYYNALKTAENIVTLPQGGAIKRFGTDFRSEITGISDSNQIYAKAFQYSDECVYNIIIKPDSIDIFLENTLQDTVSSTGITAEDIELIDTTVLDNNFRICTGVYIPKDLQRSASAANAITAYATNTLTITTPLSATDLVFPCQFTTSGSLPTSSPQIQTGRTYFLRTITTSTVSIYNTAIDARNNENSYTFTALGSGSNVIVLDNWSLNDVDFKNTPVYDFDGGYDAYTFTPGATSGYGVTITSSSAIFTDDFIGGAIFGNGGIARIVTVGSASPVTTCTVDILQDFDDTSAIPGTLIFLGEPAWSDTRGWPKVCSSYQSRAYFANTSLLQNGIWGSVVNDYDDFNDLESDDDSAISWYPSSDQVNYIRWITPYRSLTVHSNSGTFSTPLTQDNALTPANFALTLQDTTPANTVEPRPIDNQIILMSGKDAHSLVWDGINNAYSTSIVSVINEQVLTGPVKQAPFIDFTRAGSRYMFVINEDGTLAMYQTLLAQDVAGWTRATLNQSDGNAYFRHVMSNFDGRAWFVNEREVAESDTPISVSGFTTDTLTATASNFDTSIPTLVTFATGTLPTGLETDTYYYAIGVDANTFMVYTNKTDAENQENNLTFSDSGSGSTVVPWPFSTKFYLEELTFENKMDNCTTYSGVATSTITGLSRFNGQNILCKGDGYGFSGRVVNGEFNVSAHGEAVEVEEAILGFGIPVTIEPLPLSIAMGQNIKTSNIVEPKRITFVTFMFNETLDAYVNGKPVSINPFYDAGLGEPPSPQSGIYEQSIMRGWDDFKNTVFTITQTSPFDLRLLGVFYKVDVGG